MQKNSKILIVGHGDIIENSLFCYFQSQKFTHVFSSSKIGLNTLQKDEVRMFFKKKDIEYIFLSSVRSGGIAANQKYAAEFIFENLESQNNVIHAAYQNGVKKLLFLAGSCVYPKQCPQPIKEEYLLTAPLEPTSEPYSLAKIAGIKLCQAYREQYGFNAIVGIPATVYGPGSDTDTQTAHVIGALIGKFHQAVKNGANEVIVWGTGLPRREFIFSKDFAGACLFLMKKYSAAEIVNIGCGYDVPVKQLAEMIAKTSGFRGRIRFDRTKPDGTMKKLLDHRRMAALGWKAKVSLEDGIKETYKWSINQKSRE